MPTKQITVLPDDINSGQPNDCSSCALALAARRALKVHDPDHVTVTHEAILLKGPEKYPKGELGYTHVGTLPRRVRHWVSDFDENGANCAWSNGFRFVVDFLPAPKRLNLTSHEAEREADRLAEIDNTIEVLGL